jgi:hypothetical protein
MRKNHWLTLLGICAAVVCLAAVPGIFSNIAIQGVNPTSGQVLCSSSGSVFDSACSPAGTPFYQTVAINGVAQTQEVTLNFSSNFHATTTTGNTNIDLANAGAGGNTYTCPASLTTDNFARVISVTNGTCFPSSSLTTACIAFSSTTASGCTVQADGKVNEWIAGATLNLGSCNTGSPGAAPSPYSGLCSEPFIALSWPVAFSSGCLDFWVTDINASTDPTAGNGQTFASGSWTVIGTPSTTSMTAQRVFSYSDAGVSSTVTSYDGHPIFHCIGD